MVWSSVSFEDTYLKCPYAEKDVAKMLGARWDNDKRQWFVPAGRDLAPFRRWIPGMCHDESPSQSQTQSQSQSTYGIASPYYFFGLRVSLTSC